MTFTKTPPTKPGAYWWRDNNHERELALVEQDEDCLSVTYRDTIHALEFVGGEWCGPLVPVEEVEKAFHEGFFVCGESYAGEWQTSRARRVVEGEET